MRGRHYLTTSRLRAHITAEEEAALARFWGGCERERVGQSGPPIEPYRGHRLYSEYELLSKEKAEAHFFHDK